ncbi:hypothetical protein Tco_0730392 [Tanacetum coccineum]|uniref:Uncharacterized protein n=1 Tax=Tanacetum coccineum TaxID=301880 RepID=A0ABQ4YSQ2_9ASTR
MSTSNVHQQSLADADSNTRPPMLEREAPRLQKEDDLRGDDLKHYEAEIEAMNLILISILNNIYNSVDRETRFNNEFDQFVAEPGKALVSVYNHFSQYVTQVRLVKRLTEDSYDDLFDYLQQFEKLVSASRAKKLEKSHDPLALVTHTGDTVQNNFEDPLTSAMILIARAITRNFSNLTNNQIQDVHMFKRKLLRVAMFRMMLETFKELFELRLQELLQMFNATTTMLLAKHYEAGVILTDEQNNFLFVDASLMEEIKQLSENICLMARIQPANIDSYARPSYDSAFLSEVQIPSTSYVNPLFANDYQEQKYLTQPKIINKSISDDQIDSNIIFDEPNEDVNSSNVEKDNNVQDSYELEQLARNAKFNNKT